MDCRWVWNTTLSVQGAAAAVQFRTFCWCRRGAVVTASFGKVGLPLSYSLPEQATFAPTRQAWDSQFEQERKKKKRVVNQTITAMLTR
jgi:hypothetical protein